MHAFSLRMIGRKMFAGKRNSCPALYSLLYNLRNQEKTALYFFFPNLHNQKNTHEKEHLFMCISRYENAMLL